MFIRSGNKRGSSRTHSGFIGGRDRGGGRGDIKDQYFDKKSDESKKDIGDNDRYTIWKKNRLVVVVLILMLLLYFVSNIIYYKLDV